MQASIELGTAEIAAKPDLFDSIVEGNDLLPYQHTIPESSLHHLREESSWIDTTFEPLVPEDEFLDYLPQSVKEWMIQTMKDYWILAPSEEHRAMITRKIIHTKNVMRNAHTIALGNPEVSWNLAQVQCIAALHDICRFPQAFHFKTFKDGSSFDHAKFGAEKVSRARLPFESEGCDSDVIQSAIMQHSQLETPEGMYEQIIRDADKLTIMAEFIADINKKMRSETIEDKIQLDEEAYMQFNQKRVISHSPSLYINNPANRILQRISWMYDLNFPSAKQKVIERGYFDQFFLQLTKYSQDPAVENVLEHIIRYKEEVMGEIGYYLN